MDKSEGNDDDDDCNDIYFDAEDPSAEADELNTLWTADVERRVESLKAKKDDVLARVVDLIADVPQLRREVVGLRKEVARLRALFNGTEPTAPPPPPPESPQPPPPLPHLPESPASTTAAPCDKGGRKKKKRKRKRKKKSSFSQTVPLPLSHSTPLRPSCPPLRAFPQNSDPPLGTYIQPRQRTHTTQIIHTRPHIHFYHDSNNRMTTTDNIQQAINTINGKVNKPQQQFNITHHLTFTLQRTLRDIQQRDLTNSIVIIDVTTNNAKRDHENHSSPQNTHNTLRQIIVTLQQKHKLNNNNIIIMETLPSLLFDINPYNKASSSICQELGVRFRPTLAGESHLFNDGIHIFHHHRWLLNMSVAAAVVGVDPHAVLHLQSPPLGPNGLWRHSWGSPNRPPPTTRWPPPGSLAHRQSLKNNSIRNR